MAVSARPEGTSAGRFREMASCGGPWLWSARQSTMALPVPGRGPFVPGTATGVVTSYRVCKRLGHDCLAMTAHIHPAGFDATMSKTLASAAVDRFLHHAHVILSESTSLQLSQAAAPREMTP